MFVSTVNVSFCTFKLLLQRVADYIMKCITRCHSLVTDKRKKILFNDFFYIP